jgi:hypothetical protein
MMGCFSDGFMIVLPSNAKDPLKRILVIRGIVTSTNLQLLSFLTNSQSIEGISEQKARHEILRFAEGGFIPLQTMSESE